MSEPATEPDHSPPAADRDDPARARRQDLDEAADVVARMGDATPLRSAAAVLAGFVVLTIGSVIAGRVLAGAMGMEAGASPSGGFVAWSLVSRFAVAILAGYLTARAAPRAPLAHGMALAGLVIFLALAAMWGFSAAGVVQEPSWYPTAMLFVGPAGVLAGSALRVGRLAATVVVALAAGLAGCASPSDTPDTSDVAEASAAVPLDDTVRVLRSERNFLTGYPAFAGGEAIHVVVEIPAGTNDKWETTKGGEAVEWEIFESGPRVVQYLAYPGNYGMIPRTLLPAQMGGDGDPLDVVLLGPAVPRGSVVTARPVGVLELFDTGEDDDKIIAVPFEGPFSEVRDLEALRTGYAGVLDIIETWFTSYKGPGVMEAGGMRDADAARSIVERAAEAFEAYETCGELGDGRGHAPDTFGEEWWSACRARMESAGSSR